MEPVRQGEKHPLENPDILSVIFKKLPLSELKSCRQVCKLWALESSGEMRHATKVYIRDGKAEQSLADFLNLVGRRESYWMKAPPTSSYRLIRIFAAKQRFWNLCGAHIRHLSLSYVKFHSADAFLQAILRSCPNLEDLHLLRIKIRRKGKATKRVEGIPPRLLSNASVKTLACDPKTAMELKAVGVRILEHFPSLHTLHIDSGYESDNEGDELIQSIAEIRRDNPAVLKLKHVDINFQDIDNPCVLLPALVDSGLHLEGISVRFYHESRLFNTTQMEVTRNVIEAHAASLEQLLITGTSPTFIGEDAIQPPKNGDFPRLKKFHLDVVRRMSILRLFPNLRELSVASMELEDLALLGDMDIKPKVTKLSLFSPQNMDIRLFARCFPDVEEIKLTEATSDQFTLVCELWPQLRSLWWDSSLLVKDAKCLNEAVITGYDDQDVERINRKGSASTWRPITARRRNIASLTNLESFVWTNCFAPLNYCAATEGVLPLPKLKNLVVCNCWREPVPLEVSREALQRFTSVTPPPPFGDQSKRWWKQMANGFWSDF